MIKSCREGIAAENGGEPTESLYLFNDVEAFVLTDEYSRAFDQARDVVRNFFRTGLEDVLVYQAAGGGVYALSRGALSCIAGYAPFLDLDDSKKLYVAVHELVHIALARLWLFNEDDYSHVNACYLSLISDMKKTGRLAMPQSFTSEYLKRAFGFMRNTDRESWRIGIVSVCDMLEKRDTRNITKTCYFLGIDLGQVTKYSERELANMVTMALFAALDEYDTRFGIGWLTEEAVVDNICCRLLSLPIEYVHTLPIDACKKEEAIRVNRLLTEAGIDIIERLLRIGPHALADELQRE